MRTFTLTVVVAAALSGCSATTPPDSRSAEVGSAGLEQLLHGPLNADAPAPETVPDGATTDPWEWYFSSVAASASGPVS